MGDKGKKNTEDKFDFNSGQLGNITREKGTFEREDELSLRFESLNYLRNEDALQKNKIFWSST